MIEDMLETESAYDIDTNEYLGRIGAANEVEQDENLLVADIPLPVQRGGRRIDRISLSNEHGRATITATELDHSVIHAIDERINNITGSIAVIDYRIDRMEVLKDENKRTNERIRALEDKIDYLSQKLDRRLF